VDYNDTDPLLAQIAHPFDRTDIMDIFRPPRQDDTRYIFYANRRRAGVPAETLAGIFPQAESFERMFKEENK
jgi:hypothetical protein